VAALALARLSTTFRSATFERPGRRARS
jgi:hypothetical protein